MAKVSHKFVTKSAGEQEEFLTEYGFVNHALELMIQRKYGQDVWEEIQNVSETKVSSPFLLRMLYDDRLTYNIVDATSEVTGLSQNEIWEMFGEMFFDFCEESGYDKILRVLGGTLQDFLQNLDALHDHLSTIYPAMKAPSFRCSQRQKDGALILHYYSERRGLEHVVIGLVKTVSRKLHNKEVNVEIITAQGEFCSDHVQFLITNKPPMTPLKSASCSGDQADDDEEEGFDLISDEPRVSPATFCKAFPFHLMMNKDMRIVQAGQSISRVIKEVEQPNCCFFDIFHIVRPQIDTSFEGIITHSNNVFVVKAKKQFKLSNDLQATTGGGKSKLQIPRFDDSDDEDLTYTRCIRLKGQMLHVPLTERLVFLCSPSVGSLDELMERGLYMSDIPIHDSTRDLILLSEQFRAEYELTQKLEVMTDKLQQTYRELEIEKQLTEKLVYSILPPSVANTLRLGKPVEAVKYKSVTILFSGICDFNTFCSNNPPMKVVNLLNELYTKFDALADPRIYNVYKVETVGDKYMLASGLPEKNVVHAKNIALVALDMLDIVREIVVGGQSVRITIGVHSGEVVAGVVGQKLPRYAVFGGTVCLASRMESTGVPDSINISEDTYKCLIMPECYDPHFSFKDRGMIQIKGRKKPMKCYFLSRNLRKLPKIQMLLENGLLVPSPCLSPACSLRSPMDMKEIKQRYFGTTSDTNAEDAGQNKEFSGNDKTNSDGPGNYSHLDQFSLPDPTAQTLEKVAINLQGVAKAQGDHKVA